MRKANQIKHISFIGSGNVATHLAVAFKDAGLHVAQVYSPTPAHARQLAELAGGDVINDLIDLDNKVDLCLLCVPDDQVAGAFKRLPVLEGVVAHTSGITSIDILQGAKHYGVLYPLQTFTQNKPLALSGVPFCIEGSDAETTEKLTELSKRVSHYIHRINTHERKYLHLTAVMVNNFTNHMYQMAEEILETQGLDFALLHPLISETADKVQKIKPVDAQTGPAKRNDQATLAMHLKMLSNVPEYAELYRMISKQINKKYHG